MTPNQAKTVLDYSIDTARRELAITAKILAAVPAGNLDYRPADRYKSAGELVWHIASSEVAILNGAAEGAFNFAGERPANTQTPAQVAAWYTANAGAAIDRCAGMTADAAARIVDFMGYFQMPAVSYVTMATNHTIHHRGQLSTYLRPMGAKVPAIYGMSADDNPFEKK